MNYQKSLNFFMGIIIGIMVPCFLMSSCNIYAPVENKKNDIIYDWNFLVYMAADNNLERFAIQDINEMELVGSSDKINILVLVDRSRGFDKTNGDWTTTRLYRIKKDVNDSGEIVSELVLDFGELDMTSPETLSMFLKYCTQNYASRRTLLTLWSHGTGVYPRSIMSASINRGWGGDNTTGVSIWDMLFVDEIAQAIRDSEIGRKIDLLYFDSCLMQMFENAWELTDVASVLVASQTTVPGGGNDYALLINELTNKSNIQTEDYAKIILGSFKTTYLNLHTSTSLSALNLEIINTDFKNVFLELTTDLLELSDDQLKKLKEYRISNIGNIDNDYFEYVDFNSLLNAYGILTKDDNNKQENYEVVKRMQRNLNDLVIAHCELGTYTSSIPLSGISINFPYLSEWFNFYALDNGYRTMSLSQQTQWYCFLERISKLPLN